MNESTKCYLATREMFVSQQYHQGLRIFTNIGGLVVFGTALSFFIVLATCKKLNWTINFLFLAATFDFVGKMSSILGVYMRDYNSPPIDPYAFVYGRVAAVLSTACINVYLYKRSIPLLPALVRSRKAGRILHIGYIVLFLADTITTAGGYLMFAWAPNPNEGFKLMLVPIYHVPLSILITSLDSLVDVCSCSIILASIIVSTRRTAIAADTTSVGGKRKRPSIATRIRGMQDKMRHILFASQVRIVCVLIIGLSQGIILSVMSDGKYNGDREYTVKLLTWQWVHQGFIMLLLIDSSLMLLYEPHPSNVHIWRSAHFGFVGATTIKRKHISSNSLPAQMPVADVEMQSIAILDDNVNPQGIDVGASTTQNCEDTAALTSHASSSAYQPTNPFGLGPLSYQNETATQWAASFRV